MPDELPERERDEWLTIAEAAKALGTNRPRLLRGIDGAGIETRTGTKKGKTGTRTGLQIKRSDLPAIVAFFETGETETEGEHEQVQEVQTKPVHVTNRSRVRSRSSLPETGESLALAQAIARIEELKQVHERELKREREIAEREHERSLKLQAANEHLATLLDQQQHLTAAAEQRYREAAQIEAIKVDGVPVASDSPENAPTREPGQSREWWEFWKRH